MIHRSKCRPKSELDPTRFEPYPLAVPNPFGLEFLPRPRPPTARPLLDGTRHCYNVPALNSSSFSYDQINVYTCNAEVGVIKCVIIIYFFFCTLQCFY